MDSMAPDPQTHSPTERHLEQEMAEVEAAIDLVLTGGASSVSLAGLSHGQALAEALRDAAARKGVIVEPIWGWEEDRCDLVVRRADGPAGG